MVNTEETAALLENPEVGDWGGGRGWGGGGVVEESVPA